MYQLSVAAEPDYIKSEFPIYWEQQSFDAGGARRIRHLPERYVTFITDLQPFWQPEPRLDLLWLLHDLSMVDKHRELPLLVDVVAATHVGAPITDQPSSVEFYLPTRRAGDPLVRIPTDERFVPAFDAELWIGLGVAAAGREAILLGQAMLNRVWWILTALDRGELPAVPKPPPATEQG